MLVRHQSQLAIKTIMITSTEKNLKALPPLPKISQLDNGYGFTAEQMREYALFALLMRDINDMWGPYQSRLPEEWTKEDGPVIWRVWLNDYGWLKDKFWCGTPFDDDWKPGYFTHWTTISTRTMQVFKKLYKQSSVSVEKCDVPPAGWQCTRAKGHDGPCAAIEDFLASTDC